MDKLKQLNTRKTYLILSGLLADYLLVLLFQSFFSGKFGDFLNAVLGFGALLVVFYLKNVDTDQLLFFKIAALGLTAVIANIQLNLLQAINQPDIGNGFQMTGFFALALAGITVLCHYDLKKTGRTRLDYTVISIGFFFFFGLLAATEIAVITR
jgi:hypothetical protein